MTMPAEPTMPPADDAPDGPAPPPSGGHGLTEPDEPPPAGQA
jgi:hypothetical protein